MRLFIPGREFRVNEMKRNFQISHQTTQCEIEYYPWPETLGNQLTQNPYTVKRPAVALLNMGISSKIQCIQRILFTFKL